MHYVYILWSTKSSNFYYGSISNVGRRLKEHNAGTTLSTAPFRPWRLVWSGAFKTKKLAEDFERYLKSGSGKAFAYKRLLNTGQLKGGKLKS